MNIPLTSVYGYVDFVMVAMWYAPVENYFSRLYCSVTSYFYFSTRL